MRYKFVDCAANALHCGGVVSHLRWFRLTRDEQLLYRIFTAIIMNSKKISPTRLVAALNDLTIAKTKELFFHLKVPLEVLDDIDALHSGNMRKINYVQAWFDRELDTNWDKIMAGLKLMGMNSLAENIALDSTINITPQVSPTISSDSIRVEPVPSFTMLSHDTSASSTSPSEVISSESVCRVRAAIDRLSDTFSDLMSDTRTEMCNKESTDSSFLDKFRDRLLDLPVTKKLPHSKFFRDSEDDFLRAENIRKIFAILKRYCSYRNYAVLREVMRKFCEAVLQQRMQEYCQSLEMFEKGTFVDVYLVAIEASDVLFSEFTKMTMKLKKPVSQCTLHEIRKLTESIAERASLESYSVYIGAVLEGSVVIEVWFPGDCVGWIVGVLSPSFLDSHLLWYVEIGEDVLTVEDELSPEDLNEELMEAVKMGAVTRVASLLNSGANIQTGYSDTPLDFACAHGHLQIVHLLITRGAELDYTNETGGTALMYAAAYGMSEVVRELILLGANVNIQDYNQNSAVIYATVGHQPGSVKQLVEADSDLNLQNEDGLTAMIIASRSRSSDIINILLQGNKIDLNIQEYEGGWTALHFSAENGDSATTRSLIEAGANVHLQAKNGWTALEIAEVKLDTQLELSEECMSDYEGKNYYEIVELLKGYLFQRPSPKF